MKNKGKRVAGVVLLVLALLLAGPSVLLTMILAPLGIFFIIGTLFLLLFGVKFLRESCGE